MNWFSGNIVEAVNLSKSRNAVFVVYCEGTDEMSQHLSKIVNTDKISSKLNSTVFVAVKIVGGSESYNQFAQLYKLVPIPSIFFIGKNGTPLEVVTGIIKTAEELDEKIMDVLQKTGLSLVSTTTPSTSAPTASGTTPREPSTVPDNDTEIVCEGGVCYKKPKDVNPAAIDEPSNESQANQEDKLKRAKELIEKKRKNKEEENTRLEKERELQRRRTGQDLQSFKERQEEMEIKKRQEERLRDKREEQAARQRILAQIEQDRAERALKYSGTLPKSTEKAEVVAPNPIASDKTEARIQFKKPSGDTEIKVFNSSEKFEVIRQHVEQNVVVGSAIREFALATTFPKKEFKADDNGKTLLELNLAPTSVILILPLDKVVKKGLPLQTDGGIFTALSIMFWGIVNTFYTTFSQSKNFLLAKINGFRGTGAQKRANENEESPNDAAKRRNLDAFDRQPPTAGPSNTGNKSNAYKRVGGSNVHKLSDIRDSDDENNTWNGNSTQQQ